MNISDEVVRKIKGSKLMALGSWILVTLFGVLSLAASQLGHYLLAAMLMSTAILLGVLFAFQIIVLALKALSMISSSPKDKR